MGSLLATPLLVLGAMAAALLAWLAMAGAVQWTGRRDHGRLHWIFPAMLGLLALGVLLSGRDLTTDHALDEFMALGPAPTRHPVVAAVQPVLSLLLLAVSGERLLSHLLARQRAPLHLLMPLGFVFFWLGSTASPALLGAHPQHSHDYLYPLVIGLAAALSSPRELEMAVRTLRNSLLLFMLGGVALAVLAPTRALDMNYGQGLLPGLARFAGLAMHPVSMGLLAQLGLLCLLAQPFERRWLQRAAWALGLGVLVMAQSKTAWLAFVLCSAALLAWRQGPSLGRRLADPLRPDTGMALVMGAMALVIAVAGLALFGQVGERLDRFFSTPEGAQLASLTGRDRIWAIAWDEWSRNPVFGYGPELWGPAFRQSIGMVSATHAHNQFMDTLSRAGLVGAVSLCLYAALLLVLSLRHARDTRGLSVALFLALLLRAMSEVPLLLFGYGPELITHVLLLMTLSAAAQNRASRPVRSAAAMPDPLARQRQQA